MFVEANICILLTVRFVRINKVGPFQPTSIEWLTCRASENINNCNVLILF